MEKRKWPWRKKSSERSPGESESSGSFSSHSERYSDEQEILRESPNDSSHSPEITSKTSLMEDEVKETVRSLMEKLSAALVNVSAKEDLVKQHAKVAEEAVAGWEKAENDVAALKQQLEAALQQNLNLEARASHLDGALKECVRQLRQSKDEHEKVISNVVLEKKTEWESGKMELENQILSLKAEAEAKNSDALLIIESLSGENSSLKQELASRLKELEIVIFERDLSIQAAENASKLQLESIKKIVRLEAECRRLQSAARKPTSLINNKSFGVSSFYAESLTDSCRSSNGSERNCSDLDQLKNEKHSPKNLAVEIDMMDDFLEMERLAALSETKKSTPFSAESASVDNDNQARAEIDLMGRRVEELENELEKIEKEKLELKNALDTSVGLLKAVQSKMAEGELRLEEMQEEVRLVTETKELLEFQLVGLEVEARTFSANVESLEAEIEEERNLSAKLTVRCRELEYELTRKNEETELQQNTSSDVEPKVKQEDLIDVAADKLSECQKTIASLGRQLESLATLEDFLMDTSNILPGFSDKVSGTANDIRSSAKCDSDILRLSTEINHVHLSSGVEMDSLRPSLTNNDNVTSAKSRNGFGKNFLRSKNLIELGNSPV